MRLRPILRGLKTYVVSQPDRKGTGGTISARYCYAVWLRHWIRAHEAGIAFRPRVVAELGPGDSLGIGLTALLCGAERYVGLDVVRHAQDATNARVFEQLIELFRARSDVPTPEEFPEVRPPLDSYAFPAHLLTDVVLAAALAPDRVAAIRAALAQVGETPLPDAPAPMMQYRVPWHDPSVIEDASVDLLCSQAVRRHGFRSVRTVRTARRAGIPARKLAPAFRGLSDEDATTAGAFVVAVKAE
jgi:hypothetical protein